jgi:hypothetical protein
MISPRSYKQNTRNSIAGIPYIWRYIRNELRKNTATMKITSKYFENNLPLCTKTVIVYKRI